MTVIFDDVDVTIEMAFGDEPLQTSPTWTDVTSYVREINVDRGRSSEFSTYGPGTCTLTVDNRDRRFDPEHTTGPFYGDLLPMVPIRVTTSYGGTDYTLFYGFVQGWPTAYNQSNSDAVSTITAVDANRLLGNIPLPQAPFYEEVIADDPLHYWTFQEPTRDPQVDVIQGLQMQIPRFPNFPLAETRPVAYYSDAPIGADAMPIPDPDVPFSAIYYDADKPDSQVRTFEVWFEYGQTTGTFQMSVFSGNQNEYFNVFVTRSGASRQVRPSLYSAIDNYYIAEYNVNYSPRTGANHLVVTYNDSTGVIEVSVNGTTIDSRSMTAGSINGPISTGGPFCQLEGDYISHYAFYESFLSSTRRSAHWSAGSAGGSNPRSDFRFFEALTDGGFPSSWTQREIGVQDVASVRNVNTLLDYMRQIEVAEQGATFVTREGAALMLNRATIASVNPVALFDDDGTDLPFSNVQVDSNTVDAIRNRVQGQYRGRFNNVQLVAEDSGSVAAYGEALETLDLSLFDVESDAQSVLDTRLARTKDPRTRVRRLDVNVRADTSMVPTVAALELADDVTVSFTPTGVGDELWRAVRVQGVSHTITLERWDCQLYLAPGPIGTNGPLLVLDDDEYGKLSSGNKLG